MSRVQETSETVTAYHIFEAIQVQSHSVCEPEVFEGLQWQEACRITRSGRRNVLSSCMFY